MNMTAPLATKRTEASRGRPGLYTAAQVIVALVAAFIAVAVVGATAATAQIVPPAPTDLTVDQCIGAEMDEGATEASATRQCVNDAEAFDRCMTAAADNEASVNEALDRCVTADLEVDEASPTATTDVAATTAPPTTSQDVGGDADGSSGVPVILVAAIALAAAAAGATIALAARRVTAAPPPPPPIPAPVISPAPAVPTQTIAAPAPAPDPDRVNLVMALIETADATSSDAVRTSIARRLQAAGVSPVVVPAGAPFDPTAHRGVQAEPAPRPDLAGTVVRTDRPGWNDRGTVLRAPEVIVYRESET